MSSEVSIAVASHSFSRSRPLLGRASNAQPPNLPGEMVRVIHTQHSGAKDLLRGHTAPITSITFAGVRSNLLATTSKDSSLIVYGLKYRADVQKLVYVLALAIHAGVRFCC